MHLSTLRQCAVRSSAAVLCLLSIAVACQASATRTTPQPTRYGVTGLFMKERVQDLREAVVQIPHIQLVSIDFETAEASFVYDPAQAFPGVKPAEITQRFDHLLKMASHHTFGIKPPCRVPREKLRRIEIPVAGLDCKACCLAAYEAVAKLDGVACATASFRDGRVTALIDPAQTDRARLEAALKKRGVQVKAP